jgi:hypothetical protein
MEVPYIYRSLPTDRSIRVLKLHPAKCLEDPIICSLIEQPPIEQASSYEALSYRWDAPTGTRPITCEGKRLLITPNCESALRHLRGRWFSRSLWIDAVCIDQSNSLEKSGQVSLMSEIYKRCSRVVVWLGNYEGSAWRIKFLTWLDQAWNKCFYWNVLLGMRFLRFVRDLLPPPIGSSIDVHWSTVWFDCGVHIKREHNFLLTARIKY